MMRLYNLVLADMKCQWRYGFYGIYFIICIVYMIILNLLPESLTTMIGNFIIMLDPMTLGLFLMGAWILLEKSQRIVSYIAISPVNVNEYIISKCVAMSTLGLLVTGVILCFLENVNIISSLFVVLFGSMLTTLIGIFVGAKAKNINMYVFISIPFEIWAYGPIVLTIVGRDYSWLKFFPGYIIWQILNGKIHHIGVDLSCLMIWIIIFYFMAYHEAKHLFGLNEE